MESGPMRPLEIYVAITRGATDAHGFFPGTEEEQAALFAMRDDVTAFVHSRRLGVVGGFDFRRSDAFVYIWCNDPEATLREIAHILAAHPAVERVQLSMDDFQNLGGREPHIDVRRPPFS